MKMMRWMKTVAASAGSSVSLARVAAVALGLSVFAPFAAEAATATRVSDFRYDSTTGLLDRERVEPDNASLRLVTEYTFDAFGNKIAATVSGSGIASRTTATVYDAEGRFPVTNTNALSQSESMVHDPKTGNLLSQTGPNGLTTSWEYDAFGRKVLETRADGTKTAIAYAYCSGVAGGSETCPTLGAYVVTVTPLKADGTTPNGPVSKSYFDRLDRQIAADTEGFDGSIIRQATEYDSFGRVDRVSRPWFLATGTPKWAVSTYDVLGRIVKVTAPDGSETTTAYHGLTVIETNDKGQTKTSVNNAQGLLASVTDAIGKVTSYTYDPFGNLLTTTDSAGNVIANTYDVRGRKVEMSDPDMGVWTYDYDVLDQLVSQTDAKNQTTTISYDLLGRMVERIAPDLTSNWVYDTATNGIGKLAEARTNAGYLRQQFYDSLGRPSQTSTTILGEMTSISTYYDADGRVSQVGYPTGFTLKYVYNARGYHTELRESATNDLIWLASAYNAEMQLTQQTAGNAVTTTRTFNANTGFLTSIKAGPSNGVADFAYAFDTIGNLTERSDAIENVAESFLYDDLNRLTEYAIAGVDTKTVAYDDLGNITFKSDVGSYSYNASGPSSVRPHAVAAIVPGGTGLVNATYTYDDNGNMTSGNGRTTTWTSFNKVETITRGTTTVAFDYNGEHTRIRQVTASRTTLYLNDPASGVSLEKSTGSGGAVTWNLYIRAGDGLVAQRVEHIPSGGGAAAVSTLYFVNDHLGSIAVIMDGTGAVAERLSYDAWGKRRFTDGTDDTAGTITSQTSRGFTGHEMIDEVGLVNMNGRIYDPQIGRFMSADPFVQDPTNSQSLNRYTYVANNPLSYTDPSGYFLKEIGKALKSIAKFIAKAVQSVLSNPRALFSVAVGAALFFALGPAGLGLDSVLAAGISGGVSGYVATGTLKGAIIGAGTALAFAGVHHLKDAWGITGSTLGDQVASAGMHGAVGCASSAAGGGSCATGFLSAGVANFAGPKISPLFSDSYHGQLLAHATVGGIAAELGGGKFANGFVTAAFGYMFNEALKQPQLPLQKRILNGMGNILTGRHEKVIPEFDVATLGFSVDGVAIVGGSVGIGIYVDKSNWTVGHYYSEETAIGVDTSVAVSGGMYKSIDGLNGNYSGHSMGYMYFEGGVNYDSQLNFTSVTFDIGLGPAHSAKTYQGNGYSREWKLNGTK